MTLHAGEPSAAFPYRSDVDRLRAVTASENNLRLNPLTFLPVDADLGTPGTQPDSDLAYMPTDVAAGANGNWSFSPFKPGAQVEQAPGVPGTTNQKQPIAHVRSRVRCPWPLVAPTGRPEAAFGTDRPLQPAVRGAERPDRRREHVVLREARVLGLPQLLAVHLQDLGELGDDTLGGNLV